MVARRVLSGAMRAFGILINPEVPKSEISLFACANKPKQSARCRRPDVSNVFSTENSQKKALWRGLFYTRSCETFTYVPVVVVVVVVVGVVVVADVVVVVVVISRRHPCCRLGALPSEASDRRRHRQQLRLPQLRLLLR